MLETLTVLAPMFVIFGIGFVAGYSHRFRQGAKGLNGFVFPSRWLTPKHRE